MESGFLQPLQGMADISVPEVYLWQMIESRARSVLELYGFQEVRPPVVERLELFVRSLGDTTDVVQKEMYAFEDRGGRKLALRPEGTAGVMRYVAGNAAAPSRLYYIGPMFRAERPQAGRRRQFHQLGGEILGAPNAAVDAECLALQAHIASALGLNGVSLEVNTRGAEADKRLVAEKLTAALKPHYAGLCEDCQRRFSQNILRILDCKQEKCREITAALPPITDFMSEEGQTYFRDLLRYLEILKVPVTVNPRLVRGLDYYLHTVWELKHGALGAQDAICGGGRYRLQFGDKVVDGVGFAMGIERLVMAVQAGGTKPEDLKKKPTLWLVSLGKVALSGNLELALILRRHGVYCLLDLEDRSMKAQMRAASAAGSEWVVIRGDNELERGVYVLKNMETGLQEELGLAELLERFTAGPKCG